MAVLLAGTAAAQQKTTVADILLGPDGTPIIGTLTIRAHQTFTASDGTVVNTGLVAVTTFSSSGSFSVQLVPNILSAPQGSYYDVYYTTERARLAEMWVVPISGSAVKLAAVRVQWPKAPNIGIPASQFLPPPGCAPPQTLRWTTTGWLCGNDQLGTVSLTLLGPSPVDSGLPQWSPKNALQVKEISCTARDGTVSINFEIRTRSAPYTAGPAVLATPLVCDSPAAVTTTILNSAIPGDAIVALTISTTTGSPAAVAVHLKYELN